MSTITATLTEHPSPRTRTPLEQRAWTALDAVQDPELDEPITDLGFVRSLEQRDDGALEVHLRLPTSFCSPSFAYLMASDSVDVLREVPGVGRVVVEIDDHHDSERINTGLAAEAGYRGTFGHEAEDSLEELRTIFRRKAHTAAAERCLTGLLRADPDRPLEGLGEVRLADLAPGHDLDALLRRREALGLALDDDAVVLVDHEGRAPEDVPMALRRARSTRISIDGNAHFCRGLLGTRYPGSDAEQAPRAEEAFVPLSTLTTAPRPEKEHHP